MTGLRRGGLTKETQTKAVGLLIPPCALTFPLPLFSCRKQFPLLSFLYNMVNCSNDKKNMIVNITVTEIELDLTGALIEIVWTFFFFFCTYDEFLHIFFFNIIKQKTSSDGPTLLYTVSQLSSNTWLLKSVQ